METAKQDRRWLSTSAATGEAVRLMLDGIGNDDRRPNGSGGAERLARIHRLIADMAWTETALALIELELPEWLLRRLVCEDGEWLCTLSRRPNCPLELFDPVEMSHATLPLAVIQAAIEAWGKTRAEGAGSSPRIPRIRPRPTHFICCDDFG